MKLKTWLFLFSIVLLSSSCNQNYGNKLESDELDIYYVHSRDESLAKNIGLYWKAKGFLGDKKQYLRLDRAENTPTLQLVVSTKEYASGLSFDERKLLLDLQDSLRELRNAKNLEIELCDNNFQTLYNINQ